MMTAPWVLKYCLVSQGTVTRGLGGKMLEETLLEYSCFIRYTILANVVTPI